jgi:lipoteichoic acid synthase
MSVKQKLNENKAVLLLFFSFYCTILFDEIILRINAVPSFWGIGLIYIALFAIPISFFLSALILLFSPKINHILAGIFMILLFAFYLSQIIYFSIFKTGYTFFSMINSAQVAEFTGQIVTALQKNWYNILLCLIPLITFFLLYRKKNLSSRRMKVSLLFLALTLVSHYMTIDCLSFGKTDLLSPYDLYYHTVSYNQSVDKLGMSKTFQLDMKRLLFGMPDRPKTSENTSNEIASDVQSSQDAAASSQPIKEHQNVMDIDFTKLIQDTSDPELKAMHEYFESIPPTSQNEYTGLYEGYNLIYITAESFSPYAIDPNLTPTLYKMSQEGYQFTNFYTPLWGVSTLDGEYVNCLGLIPKEGTWSLYESSDHSLPFSLGNQFRTNGYTTYALHDHTYNYYHRDQSHPNLGYTYKGLGNGLNLTRTWPESDLEMVDATTDLFTGSEPFHIYYLTVSGHMTYTFEDNAMAAKHYDLIKDLPLSESCKAYLACNIELDRAMELLLERLEEAGVADKTVIAIAPDHYPYALQNNEISEFLGHPVEENFEIYRSCFLLYTPNMKPQTIEKPCSNLDILPTLSNLFGLEYDSRLLMGTDIFSDSEPLVMFENRSWITDKAMFNAQSNTVTSLQDEPVTQEYVNTINQIVTDKFDYSAKILDYDYYRIVMNQSE